MEEIWKDIEGFEGLYQVSNLGRIKRLAYTKTDTRGRIRHKPDMILNINSTSQEYLSAELWKNGKAQNYLVHRLVAIAFISNPEHKETVNHIDGDKRNNYATNLEWATFQENNQHAHDLGLNHSNPNESGATKRSNEVTRRPVYCVETDTVYISRSECARQLGIYSSSITDSIQRGGTTVRCKGRYFTFKEVEK